VPARDEELGDARVVADPLVTEEKGGGVRFGYQRPSLMISSTRYVALPSNPTATTKRTADPRRSSSMLLL
jgi:hypothetical protein